MKKLAALLVFIALFPLLVPVGIAITCLHAAWLVLQAADWAWRVLCE
jgi:hypothetical protein